MARCRAQQIFFFERKTSRAYLTGGQRRPKCRQFIGVVQQNACYHSCTDNNLHQNVPQICSRQYSADGNPETGDGGDDYGCEDKARLDPACPRRNRTTPDPRLQPVGERHRDRPRQIRSGLAGGDNKALADRLMLIERRIVALECEIASKLNPPKTGGHLE